MPEQLPLTHPVDALNTTIVRFNCRKEDNLSFKEQEQRLCEVQRALQRREGQTLLRFYAGQDGTPWRLFLRTYTRTNKALRNLASRNGIHMDTEDFTSFNDIPPSTPVPQGVHAHGEGEPDVDND